MDLLATFIWDTVVETITGFVGTISNVFAGIGAIFYDDAEGLTIMGALALLGFVVLVVRWGFSLVLRLIKIRK